MQVFTGVKELRGQVAAWKREGLEVGLVPTMGYLHEGHLVLIREANAQADRVIVSVFVNPTQFGPGEDYEVYPRDEAGDLAKAESAGAHAVFMPPVAEIYQDGAETSVLCERLPLHLCGAKRPEHFKGVTTVVAKLFGAVQPDVAVFGEKDFQQLQIIRRMTRDLLLPIRIVGIPTVREPGGLAMSSRNDYLSEEQRSDAKAIRSALLDSRGRVDKGEVDVGVLSRNVARTIEEGGGRVDYIEVVNPDTLEGLERISGSAHLAVAAFFGPARLIDNIRLRD